jgi:hypothetical protein
MVPVTVPMTDCAAGAALFGSAALNTSVLVDTENCADGGGGGGGGGGAALPPPPPPPPPQALRNPMPASKADRRTSLITDTPRRATDRL